MILASSLLNSSITMMGISCSLNCFLKEVVHRNVTRIEFRDRISALSFAVIGIDVDTAKESLGEF